MFRGLVVRVGFLLLVGHDRLPLLGNSNANKKDIPSLECDVTLPSYFQDIGQFHLVSGKGAKRDSFFRCPCRVVDQHSTAGNTFSRPVLQTNPIVGAVINFGCGCTTVKKPFRLSRDGLGEVPEAIPLTTLL